MARLSKIKSKAYNEYKNGNLKKAEKLLINVCNADASDTESKILLASVYVKYLNYRRAYEILSNSLNSLVNNSDGLALLGEVCIELNKYNEANEYLNKSISQNKTNPKAYFLLGELCRKKSDFDNAESYYNNALQHGYSDPTVYYKRGLMLKLQSRYDEAIESFRKAYDLDHNMVNSLCEAERMLPVIYSETEEIKKARDEYAKGLDRLSSYINTSNLKSKYLAYNILGSSTNFYLQYQGCNDLELQNKYGEIANKLMSDSFPEFAKSIPPGKKSNKKIKVGYVSSFLRNHNGAIWLLNWIRHSNRDEFEIYCYQLSSQTDDKTSLFKEYSDHFYILDGPVENIAKRIYSDELDILVYPELGMSAECIMLAALRLAPVQCVGWGHPVTSGLSTMDYWLSSELMEPEDGDKHYCEKLIKLPNLANYYTKDQHLRVINELDGKKTRSDFGLPDDKVLYFCSQSLFKYLPEYDYLWPEIALKCTNSKFVFLAISSIHVVKKFMSRIDNAFKKYGLNAEDYCIMLNRQTPDDYLILNRLVDVFLDNPPWSGNNTCMAAMDSYLPVVTLPTKYMRGRHSYAILNMLNIKDTIASNEQEYIEIASKLGIDSNYRESIRNKIIENHDLIYNDISVIKELENFYKQVAGIY